MNPFHLLPSAMFLAAACGSLVAQTPANPPPWWRVNDDVTVSLFYDFSGATPLQPTLSATPSWYSAAQTAWTLPGNVLVLPSLTTHNSVLAMVGTGAPQTAQLTLKVDNDPHLDWIKVFFFQYDEFKGTSGSVAAAIRKDLGKYGRATVTEESRVSIGGGWETVTVTAKLVPQPDDEKIDWSFFENAFGTVAIDNLFVNSKCVKPGDDEKGGALGKLDSYLGDLFTTGGVLECRGAAVTQGSAPTFTRTYWVGTRSTTPGSFHQILRLNQTGTLLGSTLLPDSVLSAPLGASDLAVAPGPLPLSPARVYVLVDARPSSPNVVLRAIDSSTGLYLGITEDLVLPPFAAPIGQPLGLAFDPTGGIQPGDGSFWVSDANGVCYEFSRTLPGTQTLLETRPISVSLPGAGFAGLGYDEKFGRFYGFSPNLRTSPLGPIRVNGFEWSAHSFQATGTEFVGYQDIPLVPNGGEAIGLDVYRRGGTGEFRMVCVVRDPLTSHCHLYELEGPYGFGWSQLGTCGMQGGPPFEGGTSFAVTLRGLPTASLAILYGGFSNTTFSGSPLPLPLALLGPGFEESHLSVSLDVNLGAYTPTTPGRFVAPVPLPPAAGLHNVPVFFQWIPFDTSVPGLMAMSHAGKTVVY